MNEVNIPRINFQYRIMKDIPHVGFFDGVSTYKQVVKSILYNMGKLTDPEQARRIAKMYVSAGLIKRPNQCEKCKKYCKPLGHHEDYTRPLMLMFLCDSCHGKRHSYLRSINKDPTTLLKRKVENGNVHELPSLCSYLSRFDRESTRISVL